MSVALIVIVTIVLGIIIYKWLKLLDAKWKLSWLSFAPGWPIIGHILEVRGTTGIIPGLLNINKRYGKLIFINYATSPNIHATDYDFVEFILSSSTIISKSKEYELLHPWLGTGLLTSTGQKWRKRRRMITPAFHFSILEQFVDSFESNGSVLINKLKEHVDDESVDIYHFVKLFALDVICETAMGVNIDAQNHENAEYVQDVKGICRISIERAFSLFKFSDILFPLYPDYYRAVAHLKHLHKATDTVVEARRKALMTDYKEGVKNDNENDVGLKKKSAFLDILLKSTIDGQPLSNQDIREEVDTFMFEGHDTTASAIAHTLYMLAKHGDIQTHTYTIVEKVIEEQKHIFEDNIMRQSTYKDLQEMKYLECVIKETLRLYPSVPMFTREAHEDLYYKGNLIPKGVSISIFIYGIMRDPDYYPDPERFDPGRFENMDGKRPYTFVPFSAGPRNCIGQKFAMLEIKAQYPKY